MLDLIAINYRNIGPFQNQKLTLFFPQGNYLIKAPIGSWKSFLFFDGPNYALYKSSSRNLLNIQSKIGFIKLIFEINGQNYYLKRFLKKGKAKDTCSSELFTISDPASTLTKKIQTWAILNPNLDLDDLLATHHITPEQIHYKNESDLQNELNDLLPPQEVFESTVLLLQDAENIFEMQPAQRLEVLKNVFNLVGIEESKDLIKDRRNEVKYQIKAYQDTSRTEEKLTQGLKNLISSHKTFTDFEAIKNLLTNSEKIIEEWESLIDKIGIQNFELDTELFTIIWGIQTYLDHQNQLLTQHKTQLTEKQNLNSQISTQITELNNEKNQKSDRLTQINSLLQSIDPQKLTALRNEKLQLQSQHAQLETKAYTPQIQSFYTTNKEIFQREEKSDFSLLQNHLFLQQLISTGKSLKENNELISGQLQLLENQHQNEQTTIIQTIKTLQEKNEFYTQQMTSLEKKITDFEENTQQQATFHCTTTGSNCPFIKAINKHHFDQREQEKQKIINEKSTLQAKIEAENINYQIKTLENQLKNPESAPEYTSYQLKKNQLLLQQKTNEDKIQTLKSFFQNIDYKSLEENAVLQKQLTASITQIESSLLNQEELTRNLETLQQEKIQLTTTLENLNLQLQQKQQEKSDLQTQISSLQTSMSQFQNQKYTLLQTTLTTYTTTLNSLQTLIEEHKTTQLSIKKLEEEEKILNNLYTILNKELLLFVLSEFLPVLSEIINSYLSNVVDYHIHIRLQESSEKLELETKIIDEKGERDIKSLSGGQRAILKLVWMLAISSYMKTKLLFLDESINNLDQATVSRVANLLQDFVKQRQMKFYTITHNSEIQAMNIRDEVLEIHSRTKPSTPPT